MQDTLVSFFEAGYTSVMAETIYDRLGEILRDRLQNDEDPFEAWSPHTGRSRSAGNTRQRSPRPSGESRATAEPPPLVPVPLEMEAPFRILGLEPGTAKSLCKKAWKKALQENHPDRYHANPQAVARATARSRELTEAWRRIERWFDTGYSS